tara:strand:+ start:253 stop:432 length:180 start_codon:yes stop_codon:yes gene_type:complete
MGGYYEENKDVIVKINDTMKIGPYEKNDIRGHKCDDYRSVRVRRMGGKRKCLLSTSIIP